LKYDIESSCNNYDSKKAEMEGTRRADIRPGIDVMVELTEDKRTGRLTGGKVKEILTSAPTHPHGIKVKLENGLVGRIKQIIQSN